ncbi:hypothetical protein BX600DRAFT_494978 [Xylariales sp. PMI_506]|nr:hypothetical protein BX600DRAFT_494978 [Xylariales sp. PMI_506]
MPLQVGIVGAGIGGLSAAIGFRRAGAEVEVFERSLFKNEVGAALTITPNGSRILDAWGFDHVKAGGVEAKNLRLVHAHTLEPAFVEDLEDVPGQFGAEMRFYHRVDLHNTLKEMAESESSGFGLPVAIRLGECVADVDCDGGVIILQDGTLVAKDLVVIADGVKSRFISRITGKDEPTIEMGWSAYRCLVPMEDILNDEQTRPIFADQMAGYWTPFYLPKAFYMVAYPCRGNTTLNIALRHTTQIKDRRRPQGWNLPATHEDVLQLLKEYSPVMSEIIKKAPEVRVHKLLRREPLERYTRGRAVIIGDAAHTIQPTHAQGAVLAIEEAAALELLFGACDSRHVSERLALYSRLLKKHIHVNQHLSDTIPGLRDEYRLKAEELYGEGLYDYRSPGFTAPVQKFFYSYDVRKEVKLGMVEAGLL